MGKKVKPKYAEGDILSIYPIGGSKGPIFKIEKVIEKNSEVIYLVSKGTAKYMVDMSSVMFMSHMSSLPKSKLITNIDFLQGLPIQDQLTAHIKESDLDMLIVQECNELSSGSLMYKSNRALYLMVLVDCLQCTGLLFKLNENTASIMIYLFDQLNIVEVPYDMLYITDNSFRNICDINPMLFEKTLCKLKKSFLTSYIQKLLGGYDIRCSERDLYAINKIVDDWISKSQFRLLRRNRKNIGPGLYAINEQIIVEARTPNKGNTAIRNFITNNMLTIDDEDYVIGMSRDILQMLKSITATEKDIIFQQPSTTYKLRLGDKVIYTGPDLINAKNGVNGKIVDIISSRSENNDIVYCKNDEGTFKSFRKHFILIDKQPQSEEETNICEIFKNHICLTHPIVALQVRDLKSKAEKLKALAKQQKEMQEKLKTNPESPKLGLKKVPATAYKVQKMTSPDGISYYTVAPD